ncbi:MAG: hypothetical protein JWO48_312 [Bryobacterales bacterium]|nr:hypothetical protein [Bryobacterales bacterium]
MDNARPLYEGYHCMTISDMSITATSWIFMAKSWRDHARYHAPSEAADLTEQERHVTFLTTSSETCHPNNSIANLVDF